MITAMHNALSLDITLQQAIAYHQAGQLQDAGRLYREILRTQPNHPDANHNLGVLAVQMKQAAAGLIHFKIAIEANPNQSQYWLSYIDALIQTGQSEFARQMLNQLRQRGLQGNAVELLAGRLEVPAPDDIDTMVALFEQERYAECETLAQVMTQHYPQYGFGWKALGLVLLRQRRVAEALELMRKSTDILPEDAEAYMNMGVALKESGRYSEAKASCLRALELKPDYVEAHSNLGNVLQSLGQLDSAVACYRRALELSPDYALAHNNLGTALNELGQLDGAVTSYRRALQLHPDYAVAHNNLGNTFLAQDRLSEAETSYRRALAITPDYAEALNNLAHLLNSQGEPDDAVACFRRALEIKPDYAEAHSNLIFTLDLTVEVDTFSLQEERKRWGAAHAAHLHPQRSFPNIPDPDRRLRIGYVSADFRGHSAAHVFGAMLVKFDPSRFDVIAYSNTAKEDAMTRHFQQSVTCWRKIVGQSDAVVADLIRQDEIDILVDLSGHSAGNRLLVFARKPAPIQVTAWGYIGGTGIQAMDVFLADPVVVPPDEKRFYTEQVRYLPNVVGAYFPHTFPEVNALPALSGKGITFGSFNRLAKVSEAAYQVWAQILLAIPDSRMVLKTAELDDASIRKRVAAHFARAGVAPERIILLGETPRHEHLATFNQVDIALDPFPHGGGVTTLEGLMMGVPVVSLRWPILVGRLSATILATLGLSDWIAETPEQYVEIAIQKAKDLTVLAELRQQLRSLFTSSVIGNPETYVRAVENEYRQLWREWCECQGGGK